VDVSEKRLTRAVAHPTAQTGEVYYFRVKSRSRGKYGALEINFARLDLNESSPMASTFSFSTF
jgi:hypothetical protein